MESEEVKNQVRQMVRSAQNVIASPKSTEELVDALEQMRHLIGNASPDKSSACQISKGDIVEARKIFEKSHYSRFLEFLLSHFSADWMSQLPKNRLPYLIDDFFLKGNPQDAFIAMCFTVTNSMPSYRLNKCITLLEKFIQGHGISRILGDFSQSNKPDHTESLRETIVLLISTLPERAANKLQREISDVFLSQIYFPLIVDEMIIVLEKIYTFLKSSKAVSMGILSSLFGKMCIMGYGELVCSYFIPKILPMIREDYVWCRVCERLTISVPERCIESMVTSLLKAIPWYGTVDKLLGNAVMTNTKLQFLLTNKLLLLRHFDQDRILHNIIGHLASSPTRRPLYRQLFKTLVGVWSDSSAIKHTSYEQHQYISRAILICVAFLQEKDKKQLRDDLLETLMAGVQCHLDSSVMRIRRLGMLVAEALTAALHPNQDKLNFDYEEDKETESLKRLLTLPEEVEEEENAGVNIANLTLIESSKSEVEENKQESCSAEDLDSDDDFEPYDMSHDVKHTKKRKPVYIRDCMEGLISSEDPDRVEACLTVAEGIIRSQPDGLREIAAEFAKILLHLQDSFAMLNFNLIRHKILIALTVQCPEQVAECLTREFFDRNYNFKQRMDMLDVLAGAAQELSQAVPLDPSCSEPKIQVIKRDEPSHTEATNWRQVVQSRIESKTRRFGKGRTKPEPVPVANKFAPVAGCFFFPLIRNFDKKENSFDLLGEDHILLVRLLYTLGIIIYAAVNAPIVRQMSKALLEFLWIFRYHPQQGVSRGVLFALCMLLLATPGHMILTDLQSEIYEVKMWLQDTVDKTVDEEQRKLGLQALLLIQQLVQQEYEATPN